MEGLSFDDAYAMRVLLGIRTTNELSEDPFSTISRAQQMEVYNP